MCPVAHAYRIHAIVLKGTGASSCLMCHGAQVSLRLRPRASRIRPPIPTASIAPRRICDSRVLSGMNWATAYFILYAMLTYGTSESVVKWRFQMRYSELVYCSACTGCLFLRTQSGLHAYGSSSAWTPNRWRRTMVSSTSLWRWMPSLFRYWAWTPAGHGVRMIT